MIDLRLEILNVAAPCPGISYHGNRGNDTNGLTQSTAAF
jgi:hypothetical protein